MSHAHITRALLVAIAVLASVAFGQPSASHGLTIEVPAYLGIRIVGAGTGARAVVFDFQAEPQAYLSALAGGAALPPTHVNRFDDVELNITANGNWNVWVYATPLTTPAGPGPHGLTLASIRVVAGAVSNLQPDAVVGPGNAPSFAGAWALATTPAEIARGIGSTSGWRSLGFNGLDYVLDVQGDETPGSYTTVVTYATALP
ncbi:MAG: hypothetical protein EA416_14455 [Trueperaceae bacterium]|nr:MAG: hypothetical protein EA416_14455 [Trueperaceae bacterium]